jgi:type II secretory pathway component PulF
MFQLAQIQPEYENFWANAKASSERGEAVHQTMSAVWPTALVNALKAGEESGKVTDVIADFGVTKSAKQSMRH